MAINQLYLNRIGPLITSLNKQIYYISVVLMPSMPQKALVFFMNHMVHNFLKCHGLNVIKYLHVRILVDERIIDSNKQC